MSLSIAPSESFAGQARRAAMLVLLILLSAGAQAQARDSDGNGAERAPAASTPAPLPTREQILSDPFLHNALSRSAEGLEVVRKSDGSLMVDLEGRFQSISTARINADGELETGCAETHESLAGFLAAHPSPVGPAASDETEDAVHDDE